MALVEAARFYNSVEGGLARARLAAEGIASILFDTEMNWGGLDGVVPVRLMVDEEDFALARRCLSE
jgi:Putative prokaryotic signal transducing protein